jgi:hypothetical protein
MNNLLALAADPFRLASLPAPVLPRRGLPRVVKSHPSRMLLSGPRRRLAGRAARPRSSINLFMNGS